MTHIKDSIKLDFDYSVVKSKDDSKEFIVINFDKLLKNEEPNDKGEYTVVCPICKEKHALGIDGYRYDPHYSKRKLGITGDRKVGHCFRCDSIFLNSSDEITLKIPRLNLFKGFTTDDISIIRLAHLEDHLRRTKDLNEAQKEYLLARNPFLNIDELEFKSYNFWEDRPNIYIPYYLGDKLTSFQLRFLDSEAPKYYHPTISHKPVYIPRRAKVSKKIIIVEGVFDALACLTLYPEHLPIAILGSAITPYQLNLIRKYYTPEEILIYMDWTYISEKILNSIVNSPISYYIDDIRIVPSDGSDPEEHLREINGIFNDPIQVYNQYLSTHENKFRK